LSDSTFTFSVDVRHPCEFTSLTVQDPLRTMETFVNVTETTNTLAEQKTPTVTNPLDSLYFESVCGPYLFKFVDSSSPTESELPFLVSEGDKIKVAPVESVEMAGTYSVDVVITLE